MRAKKNTLTKQVMQEALTLRLHGYRSQEVAARYGVTDTALTMAIQRYGLRKDWREVYHLYKLNTAKRAIQMRRDAFKLEEILEELNIITHGTLDRIIKDAGKWKAYQDARKNVSYKKRTDARGISVTKLVHYRGELGLSYREIGEIMGQPEHVIRYYCQRNNIHKANISEAIKNREKWGNKKILS